MSLFWAIAFGGLGLRFGTLGAVRGTSEPAAPPPEGAPELQFNVATNSQLLVLLEDF